MSVQVSQEWSELESESWTLNPKNPASASHYSTAKAQKKENRYYDILPYNSNYLSVHGKYFNGSRYRNYLLTQCPLPHQLVLFWDLIDAEKVEVVVCLAPESELDTDYFSHGEVTYSDSMMMARTLKTPGSNIIMHIHVTGWVDNSSISSTDLQSIVSKIITNPQDPPKILVHCLAGVGRTGTFVATAVLRQYPYLSPVQVVRELRASRWGCVRSLSQYQMLF